MDLGLPSPFIDVQQIAVEMDESANFVMHEKGEIW